MNTHKILITGVSGFIGKHLYHKLSKDYLVFGISRTKLDYSNCYAINLLRLSTSLFSFI